MKILRILFFGLLAKEGYSAPAPGPVPVPLGDLVSQREAFGEASFRDARQTPIFNDLEPNNFLLPPPQLKETQEEAASSSQSDGRGKSIDASGGSANLDSLLVGFTPVTGSESVFPSLPVGVPIPSGEGEKQNIQRQSVSRVGIPLPDSTLGSSGVQAGAQITPFSDQDNLFSLGGIQISSENNLPRTQVSLDRNNNNIFGVSISSDQSPKDSIDLSSLLNQGVPLPSSKSSNVNVQISPGTRVTSSSDSFKISSQSFNEHSQAFSSGVPLPSSKGGSNVKVQISSGVPLPPKNQNGLAPQQPSLASGVPLPSSGGASITVKQSSGVPLPSNKNEPNNIPDRGAPLTNGRILSSQDRKTLNLQANSGAGVPLPSLVETSRGTPNSQLEKSKDQQTKVSPNSDGGSLISSQGQNAIREFPGDSKGFPSLPKVDGSSASNGKSSEPSSQSANVEIDRNSGDLLSSIIDSPGGTEINLSNDETIGSLLGSLASEPGGPIDLSSALADSEDVLKGIEDITIGDLLMGINGHNGIMVVPMSSVGDTPGIPLPAIGDPISDNNIGKSVADAGNANAVDVGVALPNVGVTVDLTADASESSPATTQATTTTRRPRRRRPTTRPPTVLRDMLSELLFSKGQWFGTLIGGLIDYGIILRDAFTSNFSNRRPSYGPPKVENSYSATRKK